MIHNIETLGWKDDIKVKQMFKQMVKQVKSIMTKRNWKVSLLSEFYPPNDNLLGLNINQGEHIHIQIRCRKPNNKNEFYDYDYILGTLLHELVHIQIGPHNTEFKKLWEQLWTEVSNDDIPAFTNCEGNKLSTTKHNPGKYEARMLAVKAAEKRKQYQSITSKPTKLGGSVHNKTARELAVLAAMTRCK